jgi:hypothetical protein
VSPVASASEGENNKENNSMNNNVQSHPNDGSRLGTLNNKGKPQKVEKSAPKKDKLIGDAKFMLDHKNFENVTKKSAPKSMADIEAQMWKDNIKEGKRTRKDFLNTQDEDFTQVKTRGINGQESHPSTFNIFRDNLKVINDKMHEEMQKNLPELNLKDQSESESSDNEDVLPLDFNTAMIGKENKIVIQAKPLLFDEKKYDEDERVTKDPSYMNMNDYLESARKDPFKEDEGAVNIDPDINIRDKFNKIRLPCEESVRLNNSFNAPVIEQKVRRPAGKPVQTK